jgi:hypothetical protein
MSDSDAASVGSNEHGSYETHIHVWNPNETEDERSLRTLTINLIGDREKVEQTSTVLASAFTKSGDEYWETGYIQEHVSRNFHKLLRNGIICDAMCADFGVTDVESLRTRLDDEDFEILRL